MDQKSDRQELERKIEQARRLASATSDQTTLQRLREFAEELSQKLQRLVRRRRAAKIEDEIRTRARELWEQHGKPAGRDQEFWVQAERELIEKPRDMRTVWIYVDTNFQVGHPGHLRVFANADAAETWLEENDPEGVAFEYEVLE